MGSVGSGHTMLIIFGWVGLGPNFFTFQLMGWVGSGHTLLTVSGWDQTFPLVLGSVSQLMCWLDRVIQS